MNPRFHTLNLKTRRAMQIFGRKNIKRYILRVVLHGRFGPCEAEPAFYSAHVLVRLLGEREGEDLSNRISKPT